MKWSACPENYISFVARHLLADIKVGVHIEESLLMQFYNRYVIDSMRGLLSNEDKQWVSYLFEKTENGILTKFLANLVQPYINQDETLLNMALSKFKTKPSISLVFCLLASQKHEAEQLRFYFEYFKNNWAEFQAEESQYENPDDLAFSYFKGKYDNRLRNSAEHKSWIYMLSATSFNPKSETAVWINETLSVVNVSPSLNNFYQTVHNFIKSIS